MGVGLVVDFIHNILTVYHFVHTILSVPFCPLPFCPRTSSSINSSIFIFTSIIMTILYALLQGYLLRDSPRATRVSSTVLMLEKNIGAKQQFLAGLSEVMQ